MRENRQMDYLSLRDSLEAAIRDVPGVRSVGLGKDHGNVTLVVVVDSDDIDGLPRQYKGTRVIVRCFGEVQAHAIR